MLVVAVIVSVGHDTRHMDSHAITDRLECGESIV